jgi:peptidoglycan/LPS O-acetylase OafA/YrhL
MKARKRFHSLDTMRGFAVFFVCWFHFTNNEVFLSDESWLRLSGKYGFIGIDIFFVISGFILTHVLLSSNYSLKSFRKFMAHRLIRLEPPYIASIVIILILNRLSEMSPYFLGDEQVLDIGQISSHIGYLTGLLEFKWLNPVYWTLGIELQFYLLIGVIFPLLITLKSGIVIPIILLSFFGFTGVGDPWILKYLPVFVIGMIASLYHNNIIKLSTLLISASVVLLVMMASGEILSAFVALLSALCIFCKVLNYVKVFSYLGTISYSLYLMHIPIGVRVISIGQRLDANDNVFFQVFILFIALLLSIIASALLHYFVEKPSISWAKRFPYN